MTLFARIEEIARDGLAALGLMASFIIASVQEFRSGHHATAWELVRAVR